ncbi:uncharacterized protein VDAG_07903 [Verticillium dahliae VdLs.17]|uniref:Uncharacterized protein n=2 Tax=Verticillium dahliae TaxID=27337 RepID=G2XCM1_VERDV|nr:uncharacterized protein VDAG_07903 [Verticillium dahliae VdLs.17]EGY16739.1 hypothetical protein VDAG_07903 [Verticillium dahliae VdLs.17]KAF3345503.1 DNA repair protein rev1 [Verticillium dahliae VDG2]KAF3359623.1 Aconitate hydratase [Verticillium dahliae VDG1]KAH6706893.1 hypothetical protein EV126DRAFT_439202 [Verticillium dahliae]
MSFDSQPSHRFRSPNDAAVHSYDRQMTNGSRASRSSSGINGDGAANGNTAVKRMSHYRGKPPDLQHIRKIYETAHRSTGPLQPGLPQNMAHWSNRNLEFLDNPYPGAKPHRETNP